MKQTVKNRFDISIKVCCASCIHNDHAVNHTHRFCDNGEGEVNSKWACREWKMHPRFADAGCGGGWIKKRDYLMYVCQRIKTKELHDLRKEWERKNGSIYIDKK